MLISFWKSLSRPEASTPCLSPDPAGTMSVPLLLIVLALIFAVASFIPGWPSHVLLGVAVILVCVRLLIA